MGGRGKPTLVALHDLLLTHICFLVHLSVVSLGFRRVYGDIGCWACWYLCIELYDSNKTQYDCLIFIATLNTYRIHHVYHRPHANPIHNIIAVFEEQVQNKFDWLGIKIYYSILKMLCNHVWPVRMKIKSISLSQKRRYIETPQIQNKTLDVTTTTNV